MYIGSPTHPIDAVVLASVPALQAEQPWSGVSNKYAFLSTAKVIEALGAEGIKPYRIMTSATRIEGKQGYTKHMLRFRPESGIAIGRGQVGEVRPEIVLTNSHDRGSSFCIELGLFRLVCANGMVVSSGVYDAFRVRHVGASIEQVLQAAASIVGQFPQVEDSVRRMQSVQLTLDERQNMAQLAMGLRWDASKLPFEPARLLSTRRSADAGTDLWTTYNVIQENLLQGQRRNWFNRGTRAVKSIDMDLKLNRGLWSLAESFEANSKQYATA